MMKRLLSLLLAVLICAALVMTASADAFIPPDNYYDIYVAHESDGDCYALNVFLSNFVEVGLEHYSEESSDSVRIATVLKHLELNAEFFSSDVKKVAGEDGKTYMRVSKSIFEKRAQRLFGMKLPASQCPGYEDGSIVVSAEHFGGPIQVFASVTGHKTVYGGGSQLTFDVYMVDKNASKWYGIANQNLPKDTMTFLGTGVAVVDYDYYAHGIPTVDNISAADFTLKEFSMDAEGIPCKGENLPYGAEPVTEPPTELPTEQPTEAPTEALTQETLTATAPAAPTETETEPVRFEPVREPDREPAGMNTGTLLFLVISVVVVAVMALVIILVVFRKK